MPVSATVVGDGRVTARVVLTTRNMATERRRTATLDCAHHLDLVETDMAGVGSTPRGSVVAKDIRDLQSWTGHECLLRWPVFRSQRREPIKRAHDLANDVGCHLRIARRGLQLRVSEQHLDHTHVDVGLKQMRREGVP